MKRLKTFLFSFLLAALSILFIAGCSTDTSSSNLGGGNGGGTDNGGGQTTPTVTPVNEFPKNPLALLGVYDITSQSVNGTSQEVTAGSEFRVNVDIARLETGFVDVLIRIKISGKTVEFTEEVSLAGETLGAEFFEKVFTDMGAKVTGEYTLEFTLAGTQYTEIVNAGIISSGDTLVINLDKTKDLEMGAGLDDSTETPETPSEPVKVESIQITTPEKSYYTGSTVTIDFTLNPSNTTETDVTYQTTNNGSGTVKAANGKGQLVLENVTQNDTVIFTIANGVTSNYAITVVNDITEIYFPQSSYVLEQGMEQTVIIENYDSVVDALQSVEYSVNDNTKANIDVATGRVIGLKNGVVTVTATATKLDGTQLTTSYELDVLGHIDYNDASSLEGTYEIVFFGTYSNGKKENIFVDTRAILTNNCNLYKEIWSTDSCTIGSGSYTIPTENFAGRAIIKNNNGTLKVHTKVAFKAGGLAATAAPDDQYQYTIYRDATLSDWLNTNLIGSMPGRNLSSTTNPENPKYYFEKDLNYTGKTNTSIMMFSHFENKQIAIGDPVSPDTRLQLRKISSKVIEMNPNTLTEEPFNKISLKLDDKGYISAPLE